MCLSWGGSLSRPAADRNQKGVEAAIIGAGIKKAPEKVPLIILGHFGRQT
jgi:hypothetical protein